jgi:hypothetical protein
MVIDEGFHDEVVNKETHGNDIGHVVTKLKFWFQDG